MLNAFSFVKPRDMVVFALGATATLIITPGLGYIVACIRDSLLSSVSSAFYLGMAVGMGAVIYIVHKHPASSPAEVWINFPSHSPAIHNRTELNRFVRA